VGFADEVEKKRIWLRRSAAWANGRTQQEERLAMKQWDVVVALASEVAGYLKQHDIPPQRSETVTWTTGGGPGRLSGPATQNRVDVPAGWRLGANGGWGYVLTPDGVLNSAWSGPSTRGKYGSLVARVYLRPLQIGTMVKDGVYWQRGRFELHPMGHIVIYGDSESPDTNLNDLIATSVAKLCNRSSPA
jgi:hypothetical protein